MIFTCCKVYMYMYACRWVAGMPMNTYIWEEYSHNLKGVKGCFAHVDPDMTLI